MKLTIHKYWDILVIAVCMTAMFVALVLWSNLQRQIFREIDGPTAHMVCGLTWGILLMSNFGLSLLRSANEVSNHHWYFIVYVVLGVVLLCLDLASAKFLVGRCGFIKNRFVELWKTNHLPTKAQLFIDTVYCKNDCQFFIETYVDTFCTRWARNMLVIWCVSFASILIATFIQLVRMYNSWRKRHID